VNSRKKFLKSYVPLESVAELYDEIGLDMLADMWCCGESFLALILLLFGVWILMSKFLLFLLRILSSELAASLSFWSILP
jgi:hypothetical protein